MTFRKACLQAHRWVGLAVGLFLSVQGLTGVVLLHRDRIEAALDPELHRVPPTDTRVELDRVVRQARRAAQGREIWYVRLPRTATETFEVWTDDDTGPRVHADPRNGSVLGVREPERTLTGALFFFHTELLAGEWGHRLVGGFGLLLVLLCATGAVAWWPGLRGLARGLRVRAGRGWRILSRDLHRAGGAVVLVVLLVSGATGAALIFHEAAGRVLAAATLSEPRRPPPSAPEAPPDAEGGEASLERMLERAGAALPGARPTWVYLPVAPGQPVTVRARFPEEAHQNGRSFAWLDPATGALLDVHDARTASLAVRLDDLIYPAHTGRIGGALHRALLTLAGLAPAGLFVTGVLIWWGRRRARARAAGEAKAPPGGDRSSPAAAASGRASRSDLP